MRRPKPVHQMTVAQFEKAFPDEEACKVYLVARRWPNGVKCPRCGAEAFQLTGSAFRWQCLQMRSRKRPIASRTLPERSSRIRISRSESGFGSST